jgi:protein SCO1/2
VKEAPRRSLGSFAPRAPLLAALAAVAVLAALVLAQAPPKIPPAPRPGGPFRLVDQNGRTVDQSILKGSWSAVFFGYTYCPDVCPATLQALGAATRKLGDRAKTFQVVFITVDPERDTPAALKTYLASQGFPARVEGLTGAPAAVAAAAKAYGVYYAKSGQGADYTVDHSAAIYLMRPTGEFDRPLSHDMTPDLIARQILDAEGG